MQPESMARAPWRSCGTSFCHWLDRVSRLSPCFSRRSCGTTTFAPLIMIQKPSLFPVQLAIGNFSNFYTTDESLLFAGLALAMLPPLVVFAVLQRCFIQGLTLGALRD